jgi:hypothetical protein
MKIFERDLFNNLFVINNQIFILDWNTNYMRILNIIWYITLFILIFTLSAFDYVKYESGDYKSFLLRQYLQDPPHFGDRKAQLFGKIINMSSNHFYFDNGDTIIRVEGSKIEKSILGETTLYLFFSKDGWIYLLDYHNYNYNYLIYVLSILAIIVFIYMFSREWRVTRRGFTNA